MKKTISCFLLAGSLLVGMHVQAQKVALGAKGGISIPNLTAGSDETPLSTGYSSRLGLDAAVFAEIKFSKLFSLQPGVEYSSQGGKKDGLQAFPNPYGTPQYLYADYKSEAKLNYLMIPVLAKFGWNFKNSPLRIYIDAGPFVGFLVSAKQVTSGNSNVYLDPAGTTPAGGPQSFDTTQNIKNQLYTTNFGVEGSIGLSYRFGANTIFIEGGGNYGFLNIQKNAEDGKNNTGAASVVLGYSYWFHKSAHSR